MESPHNIQKRLEEFNLNPVEEKPKTAIIPSDVIKELANNFLSSLSESSKPKFDALIEKLGEVLIAIDKANDVATYGDYVTTIIEVSIQQRILTNENARKFIDRLTEKKLLTPKVISTITAAMNIDDKLTRSSDGNPYYDIYGQLMQIWMLESGEASAQFIEITLSPLFAEVISVVNQRIYHLLFIEKMPAEKIQENLFDLSLVLLLEKLAVNYQNYAASQAHPQAVKNVPEDTKGPSRQFFLSLLETPIKESGKKITINYGGKNREIDLAYYGYTLDFMNLKLLGKIIELFVKNIETLFENDVAIFEQKIYSSVALQQQIPSVLFQPALRQSVMGIQLDKKTETNFDVFRFMQAEVENRQNALQVINDYLDGNGISASAKGKEEEDKNTNKASEKIREALHDYVEATKFGGIVKSKEGDKNPSKSSKKLEEKLALKETVLALFKIFIAAEGKPVQILGQTMTHSFELTAATFFAYIPRDCEIHLADKSIKDCYLASGDTYREIPHQHLIESAQEVANAIIKKLSAKSDFRHRLLNFVHRYEMVLKLEKEALGQFKQFLAEASKLTYSEFEEQAKLISELIESRQVSDSFKSSIKKRLNKARIKFYKLLQSELTSVIFRKQERASHVLNLSRKFKQEFNLFLQGFQELFLEKIREKNNAIITGLSQNIQDSKFTWLADERFKVKLINFFGEDFITFFKVLIQNKDEKHYYSTLRKHLAELIKPFVSQFNEVHQGQAIQLLSEVILGQIEKEGELTVLFYKEKSRFIESIRPILAGLPAAEFSALVEDFNKHFEKIFNLQLNPTFALALRGFQDFIKNLEDTYENELHILSALQALLTNLVDGKKNDKDYAVFREEFLKQTFVLSMDDSILEIKEVFEETEKFKLDTWFDGISEVLGRLDDKDLALKMLLQNFIKYPKSILSSEIVELIQTVEHRIGLSVLARKFKDFLGDPAIIDFLNALPTSDSKEVKKILRALLKRDVKYLKEIENTDLSIKMRDFINNYKDKLPHYLPNPNLISFLSWSLSMVITGKLAKFFKKDASPLGERVQGILEIPNIQLAEMIFKVVNSLEIMGGVKGRMARKLLKQVYKELGHTKTIFDQLPQLRADLLQTLMHFFNTCLEGVEDAKQHKRLKKELKSIQGFVAGVSKLLDKIPSYLTKELRSLIEENKSGVKFLFLNNKNWQGNYNNLLSFFYHVCCHSDLAKSDLSILFTNFNRGLQIVFSNTGKAAASFMLNPEKLISVTVINYKWLNLLNKLTFVSGRAGWVIDYEKQKKRYPEIEEGFVSGVLDLATVKEKQFVDNDTVAVAKQFEKIADDVLVRISQGDKTKYIQALSRMLYLAIDANAERLMKEWLSDTSMHEDLKSAITLPFSSSSSHTVLTMAYQLQRKGIFKLLIIFHEQNNLKAELEDFSGFVNFTRIEHDSNNKAMLKVWGEAAIKLGVLVGDSIHLTTTSSGDSGNPVASSEDLSENDSKKGSKSKYKDKEQKKGKNKNSKNSDESDKSPKISKTEKIIPGPIVKTLSDRWTDILKGQARIETLDDFVTKKDVDGFIMVDTKGTGSLGGWFCLHLQLSANKDYKFSQHLPRLYEMLEYVKTRKAPVDKETAENKAYNAVFQMVNYQEPGLLKDFMKKYEVKKMEVKVEQKVEAEVKEVKKEEAPRKPSPSVSEENSLPIFGL